MTKLIEQHARLDTDARRLMRVPTFDCQVVRRIFTLHILGITMPIKVTETFCILDQLRVDKKVIVFVKNFAECASHKSVSSLPDLSMVLGRGTAIDGMGLVKFC